MRRVRRRSRAPAGGGGPAGWCWWSGGSDQAIRSPCRPCRPCRRRAWPRAFSGLSATTASVVRNSAAIDAAFCSAERVTLAGSMMPAVDHVDVLAGGGVEAVARRRGCATFSTTTPPSRPALTAICLQRRVERDLARCSRRSPRRRSGRACRTRSCAAWTQRHATTGDDALLDGRLRVANGVLDAVLALLELDLGGRADLDDRNAAGQLGQALLQLLAVVVGVATSRSRRGSG